MIFAVHQFFLLLQCKKVLHFQHTHTFATQQNDPFIYNVFFYKYQFSRAQSGIIFLFERKLIWTTKMIVRFFFSINTENCYRKISHKKIGCINCDADKECLSMLQLLANNMKWMFQQ